MFKINCMATILDKDLVRECTVKHEDREIVLTLTQDQKISMKLKGLKSGDVSIGILDLFKQLKGEPVVKEKGPISVKSSVVEKGKPMISLTDLMSHAMVTHMDYKTKTVLYDVISSLTNEVITV